VPVALITAADGVCHLTPAALIISRQRRHNIYPHRGRADRERTNENDKRSRNRARTVCNGLSDRGRVGGRDWLQRRAEIARVSVRQTLDGHGRQPRPLCWSFMGWQQACVVSQSRRRLWDVRYTGGGRLERWVEQWAAQWRNDSPDWLISYPMQAVHPVYRQPVL